MRYKKIKLTQEKYALVDTTDFEEINKFSWHYDIRRGDKTGYAFTNGKYINGKRLPKIRMHNFIFGENNVDHVNSNGLDNRRCNLRKATPNQQAYNKSVSANKKSLGCKGVSRVKDSKGIPKYWIARITANKNRIYLGIFKSHIAASRAYIKKAKELHGEFAKWK